MAIARASFAIVALAIAGCASDRTAPAPVARPVWVPVARPSIESAVDPNCRGADVRVLLPMQDNLAPADVVKEPELGPEPPPPEPPEPRGGQLSSVAVYEAPRLSAAATAVARAIEAEMPDASCDAGYDTSQRCWRVGCKFRDVDVKTMTYDQAERRAQRIRTVVTPAVRVDVDTCPYEIYDGR